MNLIIFVESGKSLLSMKELCQHSKVLEEQGAPFVLDGAVFGSDDFCADIGQIIRYRKSITHVIYFNRIEFEWISGATRTSGASELMFARQYFVTVAKTFRLQAIDLVHIDFKV